MIQRRNQAGDEKEPPLEDWWRRDEASGDSPELDFGDGHRLVLNAPDPFSEEEWAVAGAN
ncbi:MAG: hypothetical protein WBE58_14505 [Verrucomicrobiales bacterium]|nr:hypothetical protein [Verrucomicrobiales bacterium]